MLCPDCSNEMTEESEFFKSVDIVEIIYTCPGCGTEFFGTLYRAPAD